MLDRPSFVTTRMPSAGSAVRRLILGLLTVTHAYVTPRVTSHAKNSRLEAEATFGMGCFWAPSEALLEVEGVTKTVVGYTGVSERPMEPPSYEDVCFARDWVEGVRVEYDEQVLPYDKLLDAFFMAQEPKIGSRQYGSFIFPHNAEQEAVAREWIERNKSQTRSKDGIPVLLTQIEAKTPFYRAENYHQQYWQKTRPRVATMIALLTVGTGVLDDSIPLNYVTAVHTAANSLVLAGLLYVLVERKLDTRVVEI